MDTTTVATKFGVKRSARRILTVSAIGLIIPVVAVAPAHATGTSTPVVDQAPAPSAGGSITSLGYGRDDTGGLSAITRMTGAQRMWDRGFYGQGVGVAVIDTGVARVPGLDQPGKVIDGPDLSLDSRNPDLAHLDAFGHGTHVAGIIAGSDIAPGTSKKTECGHGVCTSESAYSDVTKFVGIAPESTIINVKVGAYDGTVDVSQVIAGIYWVIQHKNDPGLNIRVLNISFGTDSTNTADIDPLAFAVDQAWAAGITVVAAAGNDGQKPGPLADPAYSPAVIAVGTDDPRGTMDTRDDVVPTWAQHGTTERPVDVIAPGVSVLSLRDQQSFVDQNVTTGKVGDRFQRASGTSQSTAVISGLVALILSEFPEASPDAVKDLLRSNTDKLIRQLLDPHGDTNKEAYTGSGVANLTFLLKSDLRKVLRWMPSAQPNTVSSTGIGSLEAARGSYHVVLQNGPVVGEQDIFGAPWDSANIAQQGKNDAAWINGQFNGQDWTAQQMPVSADWVSSATSGGAWSGARWSGARWSDDGWSGARWSGARWSDADWN